MQKQENSARAGEAFNDDKIPLPAQNKFAACGDGIVNGGEQCDDGNLANGDGCSASCTVQAGFTCFGSPSSCTTTCGDGIKAGAEQCDDGNSTNGDGCSASCTVQAGFTCFGSPSSCTTTCGDGIKAGAEQCDDGNSTNGDGCSATCTVQAGFTCFGSPSSCTTTCGDGIKAGAEQCDDGNSTNGDGCSANCTIQAGYNCVGSPSVCTLNQVCGDGIIQGGEACDDGNTVNGDGCSATCQVQSGYTCFGQPSMCTSTCGDGIVAGSEACDDGNAANGDGCSATCGVEAGFTCTGSPSVCIGPPANDNCSGATALAGTSGTVNGTNANATNPASSIPMTCASASAKDVWYKFSLGVSTYISVAVNPGTQTDPAVAVYSGTCTALTQVLCNDDINPPARNALVAGTLPAGTYFVRVTGFYAPGGTFSLIYNLSGAGCGDNIVQFGEECDDGNVNPGDGCSSSCTFENTAGIKGVAVNLDAARPAPSALLDVKSNDRGVLIPRMSTSERTAIVSPAKSLLVFDITTNSFWYFKTGVGWTEIASSGTNTGFGASNGSNQVLGSNLIPTLIEQYDDGNNFTTIFTAPQTGVYNFSSVINFTLTAVPTAYVISAEIRHPTLGTQYGANSLLVPANFAGTLTLNISANTKLAASTPVGMAIFKSGTGNQTISSITFNGFKVY